MERDTQMIKQALSQRWPIKPEYRELLVRRAVQTLADPKSSKRELAAASKILLAAESQNNEAETTNNNRIEW